jgi:hypothetical protein
MTIEVSRPKEFINRVSDSLLLYYKIDTLQ